MGRVEIMQSEQQARLLAYLEHHAMPPATRRGQSQIEGVGVKPPAPRHFSQHALPGLTPTPDVGQSDPHWLMRLWVLVPFLVLIGLGLFRWWRHSHHA